MVEPTVEPGSFRDPASTVFYADGAVYRGLSDDGARDWKALAESEFFERARAAGQVVATEEVDVASLPGGVVDDRWATVLRHERIPFVSYPYEWSFSMLRDAAALHLDLMIEALAEGFTMKDGYAYNVQFHGARPVFIDIGSFEPSAGGPWAGYRQFCQSLLYPLMLLGHKGVDYRPWMRGSVEGIAPADMRALMTFRDNFRAGMFKHVRLHAAMASRFTERAQDTKSSLEEAGFSTELTQAMVKNLRKAAGKVRWKGARSHWSDYHDICIYEEEDRREKEGFVRDVAAAVSGGLALDLGCNDGTYSFVAAEHADHVVAVDGAHPGVDALYRRLREDGGEMEGKITPLVMDLADPSPGIGWRAVERRPFDARGDVSLVLALALVHHVSITNHVPLAEVVAWLASFGGRAVIEFPHRDDPFVERLLANKPPGTHDDYTLEHFEAALAAEFHVDRRLDLPCGTRTLFAVSR